MRESELQRKERERRENLQRLRGFRPIDDDFMRCLFRENIELTQFVLRILTGKRDLTIISVETQADMKRLAGARSICLDAYGTDSSGKKYDLEIQRTDKGAGAHRARDHSSVMDIENLDAKQEFNCLPDTYTIFITENDLYGAGKALYPIERINMATGEPFNDGEHILYVNGAYRGDDEIGRLMHDFSCSDPNDMINEELADRTRYFKETEEGVSTVCKVIEEMQDEKERETITEAIKNIMETLNLTVNQAMDALKIPDSEREGYLSRLR